ncbi:MAG: SDR family oxidoreductase [Desulfobacteraceae bacterium]|nr:SDR family oxidoreductase [Desulfobacteraceae bacterium]
MSKNWSFKDKVIIITGGAGGIGKAIGKRFASAKANVVLLDMDRDNLEACVSEFAKNGYSITTVLCDVTNESECKFAIDDVIKLHGGIDVLINNAGITHRSLFIDTDVSVFKKVMDVNFFGSLYCTKAAIHSLIERNGLIVANESIAGIAPLLARSGYSASKHAMHGLFTSIRAEVRSKGVRVMIVCPGFIQTPMQTKALGKDGNILTSPRSDMGKPDTPENTAENIYQGAVKGKNLIIITPVGKLAYWISRIAPVIYEKLMTRQFKSELTSEEKL